MKRRYEKRLFLYKEIHVVWHKPIT